MEYAAGSQSRSRLSAATLRAPAECRRIKDSDLLGVVSSTSGDVCRPNVGLCQSFVLFDPNIFHIFRAPDAQIVQVFRAEMVRLAACLGDSGAVDAFIRLGLGREDRVLVFRCDFATFPTPPVRMVSF